MTRTLTGWYPGRGRIELTLAGPRIERVTRTARDPDVSVEEIDGEILLPGMFDIQVNGYAGVDFNDEALTADGVAHVIDGMASQGVTAICPAIITGPSSRMQRSLRVIAEACRADERVSQAIVGAHIEGPWISAQEGARGAHPVEHIRPPSVEEFRTFASLASIAIVTVAAEVAGIGELIRYASHGGTLVSLGHSAATPEDISSAVACGATMSTHLGNGVAAMLPRHPNLIWEQLRERRLTAAVIGDGHHLDLSTLVAICRAKGPGGWLLTSDVTSFGGMSPGHYSTPIGGRVDLAPDGRLVMSGTTYLAGAARTLIDAVSWLLASEQLPARQIIDAVSSVPGRLLGTRRGRGGVLGAGRTADIAICRWDRGAQRLRVTETIRAGHTVYRGAV